MSHNILVLKCVGPLQSWGVDSEYKYRHTHAMPTKSAIAGLCCAALGYTRGSENESLFLSEFNDTRFITLRMLKRSESIQRKTYYHVDDFHTVNHSRKATGGQKESHMTKRTYLTDVDFGVFIEGQPSFLKKIKHALSNPVWGIWFGRKTCIPSEPVLRGIAQNKSEAFDLLGISLSANNVDIQMDANDLDDGVDTLSDLARSFESYNRKFRARRISRPMSIQDYLQN